MVSEKTESCEVKSMQLMPFSRMSIDATNLKVIGGIGVIKRVIMIGCGRAPPAGKPKYKHRWNR
jgi:hypothetical protein